MNNKLIHLLGKKEIKKLIRYLRNFLNGVVGIFIELLYPLFIFLVSSIVCLLFFILTCIKK